MEKLKFGILGIILIFLLSGCNQNTNEAPKSVSHGDIKATTEGMNSEYSCSYDLYNCDDFETQKEGQVIFEACGGPSQDVHNLDRDNDWVACEDLP